MSFFPLSSRVIALITLAVAGLWVGSGMVFNDPAPARPVAADKAALPYVDAQIFTGVDYRRELLLRGRSATFREVNIRARTAGTIATIERDRGSAVKKGQIIATFAEDDRPARLEQANALLAQRKAEYEAAQNLEKKGFRSYLKLTEAKARMRAAEAAKALIQLDIAHTRIRSPFNGILNRRDIEVGDYLKVGDAMAHIVDLDPLLIKADVNEDDVNLLEIGQEATMRFADTIAGTVSGTGIITFIDKVAQDKTRTFAIEITVPNPDEKIRAGLSSEIRVMLAPIRAYRISPSTLTLSDSGNLGVKLIDSNDRVVFHPVTTIGQDQWGLWVRGLPESGMIITRGQAFVRPGQQVRYRINAEPTNIPDRDPFAEPGNGPEDRQGSPPTDR